MLALSDRYTAVDVAADSSAARLTRRAGWITVHLVRPRERQAVHFDLDGSPGMSDDEDRP